MRVGTRGCPRLDVDAFVHVDVAPLDAESVVLLLQIEEKPRKPALGRTGRLRPFVDDGYLVIADPHFHGALWLLTAYFASRPRPMRTSLPRCTAWATL